MPQISAAEYHDRLARLQGLIERHDLDLFIVSARDSIYYLTGAGYEPLERPFFLIVGRTGAPHLIAPMLDKQHMEKGENIDPERINAYWDYPAPEGQGWPERLLELIEGAAAVGVEPALTMEIRARLSDRSLLVLPLIEELRLVKSAAEIEMIRRAGYFADMALSRLLNVAYYGSLTIEGFAQTSKITQAMIREVPDYDPVNSSILMAPWAAPRSGQPHSIPQFSDALKEGPHVALVLTRTNGYSAEVERTFFTAPPDPWSRTAFEAMMEARKRVFAMIRPGQNCAEIDAAANEFLASEGFSKPEERLHRTGHGFGLGAHEAPWIAEGSDHVLQENMVISNEPGIYRDGFGGVRHSDTVLVTRDGYEVLTKSPTDLESLIRPRRPSFRQRFRGRLIRKALNINI